MQRGDVYWARLDPVEGSEQGGRRPVLIVSRDMITANSPIVIILPISSVENFAKIYPSQILLRARETGLPGDSVVMAEQIRTISKNRLERHVSSLQSEIMKKVDDIIKVALALKD